jgi:hypothetical protein
MAKILNYPTSSDAGMDRWRAEAEESDARLRAKQAARDEQRRAVVSQAAREEWRAQFTTMFADCFAQATAEGSLFDAGWIASFRGALDQISQTLLDRIIALEGRHTDLEAQLAEAKRRAEIAEVREHAFAERAKEAEAALTELQTAVRGDVVAVADDLRRRIDDVTAAAVVALRSELDSKLVARLVETEKRAERAEERARALESAMVELRGVVRNDVIRLSDDSRERMRGATAATAAELRVDVSERFAALRSEFGEKIAALSARPSIDEGQVDRTVEAGVARTRVEMRAEFDRALDSRLKEKERAFEERIAEFERRTVAADERACSLEAVVIELRQRVCDDAIRLADDLRARTRDASVAATIELRSELESKFEVRFKAAEKRAEAAEARALERPAPPRCLGSRAA